jgi:hypothetical protein
MRRLLSCRINHANDADGAEQTREKPNDVAHKGSVVVRFVKWTKTISADDTSTVIGRSGVIVSCHPRSTRRLRYRNISLEVFRTDGRAPSSFGQAARSEISHSIRRRMVRSAKSKS